MDKPEGIWNSKYIVAHKREQEKEQAQGNIPEFGSHVEGIGQREN